MNSTSYQSIPFLDVVKYAKKVVLKSKKQVQNGRAGDNKKPWGKWNQFPTDYTGSINDPKYPTAIVCDYIPDLDLHLGIIDLDIPKNKEDIPINSLKSIAVQLIGNTYSVQTASGGYHIYFLSKQKPKAKQPSKLNVDYQANTGKGNGKYVIVDYRWNKEGQKEYYHRLGESPKDVLVVDSIDKGFNDFLSKLEQAGYIKTPQSELKNDIINLIKPCIEIGGRQFISCTLAGYLRKQGFDIKTTRDIIKGIFADDEELSDRLNNVNRTYNADITRIKGFTHLKTKLPPEVMDKLQKITDNGSTNLRNKIAQSLMRHKEPRSKEIADLINSECDFYVNPQTQIYYELLENGSFQEIDYQRIIDYCNQTFGPNQISDKACKGVLSYITNPVTKDYDLIEFTNGLLNTKTKEFTTDKTELKKIPKLLIPFNWNSEADGGYIKEVIEEILDKEKNHNNYRKWCIGVGHIFMGLNTLERFMIVVGPSRSGKSTLSAILGRIFNASRIPTQKIVANERFALIDMVDKDVNIDDDINNGLMKGIGNLNSVTEGKELKIEKKGINELISLTNQQIPKLVANGNSLPPVIGEGFDTRLLLIKAPNKKPINKRDEKLQGKINQGEYDLELEWLVHETITTYWKYIDNNESLLTQEEEDQQTREYEFQSYPLKVACETLFEEDWEEENTIEVKEINRYLKMWCRWAYKEGKISKEHLKPTRDQMFKAMANVGYTQKIENYYNEYDKRTSKKVYEDIKLSEKYRFILGY